jgi:hypothetical protein
MVGALGLIFALRVAALSGTAGEAAPPVLGPSLFLRQDRAGAVLAFSAVREPTPAAASSFHYSYRPREWVALVADRLNLRDAGVTHVALWVASWPLRLDASDTRVCLRVSLPMP